MLVSLAGLLLIGRSLRRTAPASEVALANKRLLGRARQSIASIVAETRRVNGRLIRADGAPLSPDDAAYLERIETWQHSRLDRAAEK